MFKPCKLESPFVLRIDSVSHESCYPSRITFSQSGLDIDECDLLQGTSKIHNKSTVRLCALQVLALVMLRPRSYTSEDVVELHCHGGPVCVRRVLSCCLAAGARLARSGEFTLRAFLNGRLDLSQV